MMTLEKLEEFRRRLEENKSTIHETLSTSIESAKGEELDPARVGRLSRMDALQSQFITRSANDRIQSELQQIDLALERIRKGTYGSCQVCENPIALARLEALPFALKCIISAEKHG